MSAIPIALPVLLLLAGGVLLTLPERGPVPPVGARTRVQPENWVRWSGLALGVLLACWTSADGRLGSGLMLAPTALAACAVLGVTGADALTPRQRGDVRTAGLTPRRIRDYLPVRFTVVVGSFAAVLVALLLVATATGSADDMGRAGRSLTQVCGGMSASHGPWPGSYYSVPLLVALAVGSAVCGLALRRTARRPVTAGASGTAQQDDSGRRSVGMTDVVAAWGLLVTGSLAGVGPFVEGAIHSLPCPGALAQAAFWVLLPVLTGAAVTALYCLAVLCGGAGRRA